MNKRALVTVGLPVFNQRETLARAVDSVNQQDAENPIELIIVDDGSTDAGVSALDLSKYNRIETRVFRLSQNSGTSIARNVVLREARGEYLSWIDADDIWYPNKLRTQIDHLAALTDTQILSMSSFDWHDAHGSRLYVPRLSNDPLRDFLSNKVGAYVWSLLGKTEHFRSIGFFDPDLRRLQDLDFMVRYAANGGAVACPGDQPLSCYNKVHARGVSTEISRSAKIILQKHHKLLNRYGRDFRHRVRLHHLRNLARFAKADRDYVLYCTTRLQEQALKWWYQ